jgi:hypothetical protein
VLHDRADIGNVYEMLASDMKTAAPERQEAWRQARASYQYSFEIWQQMRGQGQLSAPDAGKLDQVSKQITTCDTALGAGRLNKRSVGDGSR